MPAQAGIQYAVPVRRKRSGRSERRPFFHFRSLRLLDCPLARAMTPQCWRP
jgi:hypothetical protein